ncbi:MAG TPA: hypothetical protein VLZ50_04270 [Terracidiphilus sp.]|nr:hypothetical protein [Terracidiphilus sp.]
MRRFELSEKLSRRADPSLSGIFESLANPFASIGTGGNIKQSLVGFGILHDGGGLASNRQHHWPFGLFELSQKPAGAPAKSRQGLDIGRNVQHGGGSIEHLLRCFQYTADEDPMVMQQFGLLRTETGSSK